MRALFRGMPLVILAVTALVTAPVQAQRAAPAPKPVKYLTAQQLRELDTHIERVRQQWEVPGLAIAIVQGDSVMLARGYGVKELGKPDRVDENTLFAIGSSGKSMTAALVATLVDEGKMRFDDPVWMHLPNFRVADPYVSREATIRDLLAHRTGLDNATGVWYGSSLSRAELIERFPYLKQGSSFRGRFIYNNLMIMTAGEAAAAATGVKYEQLLRQRLLQPLEMTSTLAHSEELMPQHNVATPHMPINGPLAPIPHRQTRNISPAGGQYSSARDMAQYLRFQLGNGMYKGKRIVSEAQMTQMRSVLISNNTPVMVTDTGVAALGYGLGWFTEYYRGHRLLRHGGAIDGMLTEMMFLPEDQIAVVILTNRSPHTMHTALTHHIFDTALGLSRRDWNGQAYTRMQNQQRQVAERVKRAEAERTNGAVPTLPLEKYSGTYSDSLSGNVTVAFENGGLTLRYNPGFVAKLEPWQYNTFRVNWQNPSVLVSPLFFVTFNIDASGKPAELRMDMLGTFRAVTPPTTRTAAAQSR